MIASWLRQAQSQNATHMIVVCDTWDWEDYPVYVNADQNVHEVIGKHTGNMQKVMEVYNLSLDIEQQLREHRAWNI